MLKMTERDNQIISFLREYKIADTHTLAKLFFSNSKSSQILCERRMKKLMEFGKVRRWREDILHPYYFYINKKPSNFYHSLMISKVYAEIMSKYEVLKIKREFELKYGKNSSRVDLMAIIRLNGKLIPMLIEVDLNNKRYDHKLDVYINEGHWNKLFGVKPMIISISRLKPKSLTPIHHITLDDFKTSGINLQ